MLWIDFHGIRWVYCTDSFFLGDRQCSAPFRIGLSVVDMIVITYQELPGLLPAGSEVQEEGRVEDVGFALQDRYGNTRPLPWKFFSIYLREGFGDGYVPYLH